MDPAHLKFQDKSFDTVLDTYGLCSVDDPVAVLKEMQRVCKDDGKILLLEHGKSYYSWVNVLMDAAIYFNVLGCKRNGDIASMVKESGMKLLEHDRIHIGSTYVYVGQPHRAHLLE